MNFLELFNVRQQREHIAQALGNKHDGDGLAFGIERVRKNFSVVQKNFDVPADKIIFHGKKSAARKILVEKNLSCVEVAYPNVKISFGHVEPQAEIKIQTQAVNARFPINFRFKNSRINFERVLYVMEEKFLVELFQRQILRLLKKIFYQRIAGIMFAIIFNVVRREEMKLQSEFLLNAGGVKFLSTISRSIALMTMRGEIFFWHSNSRGVFSWKGQMHSLKKTVRTSFKQPLQTLRLATR